MQSANLTDVHTELPADPILYVDHPPKVDYYDLFYFETRVRDMITNFLEPWRKAQQEDMQKAAKLRIDYDRIIERLHELECFALIKEWKLKPSHQLVSLVNTDKYQ